MSIEDLRCEPVPPVGRRDFLRLGTAAALAASVMAPTDVFAIHRPGNVHRQLAFLNQHTGERLTADYWVKGRYQPDALRAINKLFRDHRTGAVHRIDPHLIDVLYALKRKVGAHEPFHIVSGYRSQQTNTWLAESDRGNGVAQHSYHIKGMAADIFLPGHNLHRLHRAALALRAGGVGYYPDSGFIHVDVGPLRHWGA